MNCIDESFEPVIIPDEYIDLCNLAEYGDAQAQYELAIKYLIGEDVTKNYAKARNLLLKAAEQGHAEALQKLCEMADNGDKWLLEEIARIYLEQGDPNTALYYEEKSLEIMDSIYPITLIDIYVQLGRYKEALKRLNRDYRAAKRFDEECGCWLSDVVKDRIFELLPYVRKKKEKAPPKPRKRKEVVHDDRQLMFDFMYEP